MQLMNGVKEQTNETTYSTGLIIPVTDIFDAWADDSVNVTSGVTDTAVMTTSVLGSCDTVITGSSTTAFADIEGSADITVMSTFMQLIFQLQYQYSTPVPQSFCHHQSLHLEAPPSASSSMLLALF